MILHSTRSGQPGRDEEYLRTVRYMLQRNTVASHRVIGVLEGQHAQMVEDDMAAWHAAGDNYSYLGIEFAQPLPSDEYSEWQLETGAQVCAGWARKYGFTPSPVTLLPHSGTAQGRRAGKSDPGAPFPLASFIARVVAIAGG